MVMVPERGSTEQQMCSRAHEQDVAHVSWKLDCVMQDSDSYSWHFEALSPKCTALSMPHKLCMTIDIFFEWHGIHCCIIILHITHSLC